MSKYFTLSKGIKHYVNNMKMYHYYIYIKYRVYCFVVCFNITNGNLKTDSKGLLKILRDEI